MNEKQPQITKNALSILKKRYLWKLPDGGQETPLDMFTRVADKVASAEKLFDTEEKIPEVRERFLEMMVDLRFVANTPTLINAGRDRGQLGACYVLPIDDSMEDIMNALKAQALVQKSGGGTGFGFGKIRERDAIIHSTGMKAVGPVPVIKLMNFMMTQFIIQGGARHGANMGSLPVDHPSVLEFIKFKTEDESCKSFNISLTITDEFMRAVEENKPWNFISRVDNSVHSTIPARELFDLICTQAHKSGDPGILFIDTINKFNPTPQLGAFETTNPCGEQPLLPYEACTLGHHNLAKYFTGTMGDSPGEDWESYFDWELFASDIEWGIRFLDNVIEVNHYALPEIEEMHRYTNRKIGLGVMGLADLLVLLDIPYDSCMAIEVANRIGAFFREHADKASEALGHERGSFPAFEGSTLKGQFSAMRNATRTTVAPTGTTAIIADCSTGIEPIFALILKRQQAGMEMFETHPILEQFLEDVGPELAQKIKDYYFEHNSIQNCPDLPPWAANRFLQANDVGVESHIAMQAVWQRYIDSAVSKTINMSNDATMDDVKKAYIMAWKQGCKGITVFRDGCLGNDQPLSIDKGIEPKEIIIDNVVIMPKSETNTAPLCPECKNILDTGGGCETCHSCGYAACGMS